MANPTIPQDQHEESMIEYFGEPIHTYTRAEALEDGFLVDLSQFVPGSESGYKGPVACTPAVWAIIEKAVENKRQGNDVRGVIWDILNMARMYKVHAKPYKDGEAFLFKVIITGAARNKYWIFRMEIGPGDNLEPVFTVSLPES